MAEFDRADATSEAVGSAMMGGTSSAERAAWSATAITSCERRTGMFRRLAGQELLLAVAIVALAVVVGF